MIDRDTVIALAKQAGFIFYDLHDVDGQDLGESVEADSFDTVERFAQAVAQKAVEGEREACARINAEKSERLGREAEEALEEGDRETCTSNRAAAHLLSVCAARIRNRGTGEQTPA